MVRGYFWYQLSGGALAVLLLLGAGMVNAQPSGADVDTSCLYFSPDPADRNGPPIHFGADMSDAPQRLPTYSPGVGRAEFVLERDTLKLSWTVTFKDLTTEPVGLHLHGPVPAEGTAPVMFDLASDTIRSPVAGEKILTEGEVAYLVQSLAYINLHTTQYPQGELRGPVRRIRPDC